VVYATPGSIPP